MANSSVKLFQFNPKYCETIGINLPESNESRYLYKVKRVIYVIFEASFWIPSLAFLLADAELMEDYGMTFFNLITITFTWAMYFMTSWKMDDISEFIEKCEAFIQKSKSACSYEDNSIFFIRT